MVSLSFRIPCVFIRNKVLRSTVPCAYLGFFPHNHEMLVKTAVGDLLLTLSSFSESAQFSLLSCFLNSVPWLLSFLFPFLTMLVLLRKKNLTKDLWKTSQLDQYASFFFPFLLLSVLHCVSLTFLAFSFSSILYPTSLTIFFLFSPVLFLISSTFLYIFAKHILLSYLPLFFEYCALNYVDPLICCLLYLSVPSLNV